MERFKLPVYGFKVFDICDCNGKNNDKVVDDPMTEILERQMNNFIENLPEHHILDKDFFERINVSATKTLIILRYIKYDAEQWEDARKESDYLAARYKQQPPGLSV